MKTIVEPTTINKALLGRQPNFLFFVLLLFLILVYTYLNFGDKNFKKKLVHITYMVAFVKLLHMS